MRNFLISAIAFFVFIIPSVGYPQTIKAEYFRVFDLSTTQTLDSYFKAWSPQDRGMEAITNDEFVRFFSQWRYNGAHPVLREGNSFLGTIVEDDIERFSYRSLTHRYCGIFDLCADVFPCETGSWYNNATGQFDRFLPQRTIDAINSTRDLWRECREIEPEIGYLFVVFSSDADALINNATFSIDRIFPTLPEVPVTDEDFGDKPFVSRNDIILTTGGFASQMASTRQEDRVEFNIPYFAPDEAYVMFLGAYLLDDARFEAAALSTFFVPTKVSFDQSGRRVSQQLRQPGREASMRIVIPFGWMGQ